MAKSKSEKEIEKDIERKILAKIENWADGKGKKNKSKHSGSTGALYCVGFVGSVAYWVQAAVGFGAVVTGVLKAAVWPAYIVYKLLEIFYGVA